MHHSPYGVFLTRNQRRPDLTYCRDSKALFPLRSEPWQPSPSAVGCSRGSFLEPSPTSFRTLHLFTGVWNPPLPLLDSVSSLFRHLLHFNQSPPLLARTVRTRWFPFLRPGSPPPSIAVCIGDPIFPLISPLPVCFPITLLAPWRAGLLATMYQRHPRGLGRGSALVNPRPRQDLAPGCGLCSFPGTP